MTHLLQARIPDDLWERVQEAAQADHRSVAQWVRLVIEDRLRGESDPLRDLTQQDEGPVRIDLMEALKASIEQHKASVAQQEEPSIPDREVAGSKPAGRAGKGRGSDTAAAASRAVGSSGDADQVAAQPADSSLKSHPKEVMPSDRFNALGSPVTEGPSAPRKRTKACKHTNQTWKVGRPYCTDCGEFV